MHTPPPGCIFTSTLGAFTSTRHPPVTPPISCPCPPQAFIKIFGLVEDSGWKLVAEEGEGEEGEEEKGQEEA